MKLINLLPKLKQEDLKYESITRNLFALWIVAGCCIALGFAGQLISRWVIDQSRIQASADVENIKAISNRKDNSELKAKIITINSEIHDYNTLVTKTPKWSSVIAALIADIPPGMRITSLTTNPKTGALTIAGSSDVRESILLLYNNIKNDVKHFTGIDYPLENLSKPTNASFHFTFMIKADALQ